MKTIDYLNREILRAEKSKNPQEHLNIVNELKEEFFGKEIDILDVLRTLRNVAITFTEDKSIRKAIILADILIAKKKKVNK